MLAELRSEKARGEPVVDRQVRVRALLRAWLNAKRGSVSDSTWLRYETLARAALIAVVDHLRGFYGRVNRRKAITARIRFQVLERDQFACVYCGRKPPKVTLVIDHALSVDDGGTNDPENLVTACVECNLGKGRRSVRPLTA